MGRQGVKNRAEEESGSKKKRRSQNDAQACNDLAPPPPNMYGETLIATNPFDDQPDIRLPVYRKMVEPPHISRPPIMNVPQMFTCGKCRKEIHDTDDWIQCESGCNFWFHRTCAGLSEKAYRLLKDEIYCEFACENCYNCRAVPFAKYR